MVGLAQVREGARQGIQGLAAPHRIGMHREGGDRAAEQAMGSHGVAGCPPRAGRRRARGAEGRTADESGEGRAKHNTQSIIGAKKLQGAWIRGERQWG